MDRLVKIGARTFIVSFLTLLGILMLAGVLTRVIEPGSYVSSVQDGREVLLPGSFALEQRPPLEIWKWFAAPVLVLGSEDSLIIIVIIAFITLVSGSLALLQKSGVLSRLIDDAVHRFHRRRSLLVALLILMFMAFGALMGIFEEVVLLVPLAVSIALSMGWDRFTGLGISVLAAGFGFSAAISNPFSIGVAQQIAGLPLFSGSLYRIGIFLVTYALLLVFMLRHIRRVEAAGLLAADAAAAAGTAAGTDTVAGIGSAADASGSRGNASDGRDGLGGQGAVSDSHASSAHALQKAYRVFLGFLLLILVYLLGAGLVPGLGQYSMPVIALIFLASALVTARFAGLPGGTSARLFMEGVAGVAPGILLILMAAGVKYVVVEGGILHSILHWAAQSIEGQGSFTAVAGVYLMVFVLNLFVGSASAKALLIMPLISPLADVMGFTRQTAVLAFSFGDGFSNMLFPTNAVLLISLGLAGLSYGEWLRRIIPIQLLMFVLSLGFLALAHMFGYGPF